MHSFCVSAYKQPVSHPISKGMPVADTSDENNGYAHKRLQLIAALRERLVAPEDVLNAMLAVPREKFVPAELRQLAYDDNALPIPEGQTISQPTIVAMMTAALDVEPANTVLEIGTGSGYQAAVLAQMVTRVVTVEFHPELAATASSTLSSLGIDNVEVHAGDGSLGWPDSAPYDRILVTAATPSLPSALLAQLRQQPGSRLVAPIGDQQSQELVIIEWSDEGWLERRTGQVRFVPLRGEAGWSDTDWNNRWKPFSSLRRKRER